MAVVAVILTAIFASSIISTHKSNVEMNTSMIYESMTFTARVHSIGGPIRIPHGEAQRFLPSVLAIIEVGISRDGLITVESNPFNTAIFSNDGARIAENQLFESIGDDDIIPIVELALKENKATGTIPKYNLRYLRIESGDEVRIGFADNSMEQTGMRNQIVNSVLIGLAALVAFFFISLLLSKWVVRPVEIAWENQKQFIANASHELKTPLTVILSNSEMLTESESITDEKDIKRSDHINAEARRMKKLLEDMLVLAKTDKAVNPTIFGTVDFSYILKSAVLMYETIAYEEGKKIQTNIDDDVSVMGDAEKLKQVAHILLDNAIKYSSKNTTINVVLKKRENNSVSLMVENTGEPIPENELQQIFLRFYRRDESRSEHDSFGLGLSIAQSIVEEHKGKIWAESDGISTNRFFVSF